MSNKRLQTFIYSAKCGKRLRVGVCSKKRQHVGVALFALFKRRPWSRLAGRIPEVASIAVGIWWTQERSELVRDWTRLRSKPILLQMHPSEMVKAFASRLWWTKSTQRVKICDWDGCVISGPPCRQQCRSGEIQNTVIGKPCYYWLVSRQIFLGSDLLTLPNVAQVTPLTPKPLMQGLWKYQKAKAGRSRHFHRLFFVIFVGGGPIPCKNKHQLGLVGFRHFSSKNTPSRVGTPLSFSEGHQGGTTMGVGGVVFGRGKPHSGIRVKACRSLREGKERKLERESSESTTHIFWWAKALFWKATVFITPTMEKESQRRVALESLNQGLQFDHSDLSTAGSSVTSSERQSPEPLVLKKRRPQPYWGGRILEMLWRLRMPWAFRVWGSQPCSRGGIPGTAPRAFAGSFRILRNFLWKTPVVLGVWPN